jgi:hypothetical protein
MPFFGSGKTPDEEHRDAKTGPYSLPPEENGDPKSVYVENCGRKYRLVTLQDCANFRRLCLSEEGWTERHREGNIVVHDRPVPAGEPGSALNQVRVTVEMNGVSADALYDSMHEPAYRASFDTHMLEGFNVTQLDPRVDIGVYCAAFPWPLSNREYVNMRYWFEFASSSGSDKKEYLIANRSTMHADYPVTSKYVRGLSFYGGHLLLPTGDNACCMIFFAHGSPEGSIPSAVINYAYAKQVPAMMQAMEHQAREYAQWRKNYQEQQQQQGRTTVGGDVPYWRTTKISWEPGVSAQLVGAVDKVVLDAIAACSPSSSSSAAAAEVCDMKSVMPSTVLVVPRVPKKAEWWGPGGKASGKDNSGCKDLPEYDALLSRFKDGATATAAVQTEIAEVKKRLRESQQGGAPESAGFLEDAIAFIDRIYVYEGKPAASVKEYLERLHLTLDSTRRALSA